MENRLFVASVVDGAVAASVAAWGDDWRWVWGSRRSLPSKMPPIVALASWGSILAEEPPVETPKAAIFPPIVLPDGKDDPPTATAAPHKSPLTLPSPRWPQSGPNRQETRTAR